MTDRDWFADIEEIVSDPLRFKAQLNIGEDVYTSRKVTKSLFEAWDIAGAATTGAQVANSAFIASRFFAAPSLLASLGIGTATAVTPIGWVVAASVLSGGVWFGITRYLKGPDNRIKVIPTFINTPLDVLALGLFDLMAPLAMRVAAIDGHIHEAEKVTIANHFVREWGYSPDFVARGIEFIEEHIEEFSIKESATVLAVFKRENPDCNYKEMCRDLQDFLRRVIEADGRIDEREEMALEKVAEVFAEQGKLSISRTVKPVTDTVVSAAKHIASFTPSNPFKKPPS